MAPSLATALNNLKQEQPQKYKLYQLALWLNHESLGYFPIEEDIDNQLALITDLQTIHTPDKFVSVLVSYDLFDRNQKSPIYGAILGDIAWGLASKYLINN